MNSYRLLKIVSKFKIYLSYFSVTSTGDVPTESSTRSLVSVKSIVVEFAHNRGSPQMNASISNFWQKLTVLYPATRENESGSLGNSFRFESRMGEPIRKTQRVDKYRTLSSLKNLFIVKVWLVWKFWELIYRNFSDSKLKILMLYELRRKIYLQFQEQI